MKPAIDPTTPLFLYALRKVTEAAARAAFDWIGRGSRANGDAAAVSAMRSALNELPIDGTIVIGEGEKDEAPHLYKDERVGQPEATAAFDVAVDPVEGTTYLAKGLTNAMAVTAMAPRGAMFDPGPAFYMEKFAAPPSAKGRIDPAWPVERKLATLAEILDKRVADLTVFVLEKPRHRGLVEEIHAAGARVALYPDGDVAGALMASIRDSGIDALMGTGGTPEGVLSACAIRALGGAFYGRLDPQLQTETKAVAAAGLDTTRWYGVEELVRVPDTLFCATGITTGLLFDGVERSRSHDRVQTLMISGATGERQILTSYLPRNAAP
jgi:fructose-1,6-bisphosphatase II